jgi:cell wall-associated NlpC family hydrolase
MTTRQDIIDTARKYLGVRYKHQGRTAFGLDCLGLVVRVAHDLGLSNDDNTDYGPVPDGRRLMAEMDARLDRVAVGKPGDVLLMRFDKNPQHLAIMTDKGIIHSYAEARRVVEHGLHSEWSDRIVRTYSFKGID